MIIKTRHVKNIQYKYGQEDKKPGGAHLFLHFVRNNSNPEYGLDRQEEEW